MKQVDLNSEFFEMVSKSNVAIGQQLSIEFADAVGHWHSQLTPVDKLNSFLRYKCALLNDVPSGMLQCLGYVNDTAAWMSEMRRIFVPYLITRLGSCNHVE